MLIVDRFEGFYAVVEDGDRHVNIERSLIASDVKEGDVIVKSAGGIYKIDTYMTNKRRKKINKLHEMLKGKE